MRYLAFRAWFSFEFPACILLATPQLLRPKISVHQDAAANPYRVGFAYPTLSPAVFPQLLSTRVRGG
jgi:hypothetical protein